MEGTGGGKCQRHNTMGRVQGSSRINKHESLKNLQSLIVWSKQNSNMKVVSVVSILVACALAAPQRDSKDAVIVKYDSDNIGVDGYRYAYETSDGTSAQEEGQLQNAGTDNESISVRGQFQFVGLDGVTYTVTYIADENGFQPQGAHIPKAP